MLEKWNKNKIGQIDKITSTRIWGDTSSSESDVYEEPREPKWSPWRRLWKMIQVAFVVLAGNFSFIPTSASGLIAKDRNRSRSTHEMWL